jgi:arginyl-tRNA synthetase
LVLLDALSWLPERVAVAARRGRPDEFARYLEELASATIAALICPGYPAIAGVPGTGRLALAEAARTGLAAGLGLLGVGAPDRL